MNSRKRYVVDKNIVTTNIAMEEWKTLEYFPNYEVSEKGIVRNRKSKKEVKQRELKRGTIVQLSLTRIRGTYNVLVKDIMKEAFGDQ